MIVPPLPAGTVAIAWATVELDRAERELATGLPAGSRFAPAPDSLVLGARCRAAVMRIDGIGVRLVIAEPSTEGRLAAFLARFGEGWAATWTVTSPTEDGDEGGPWRPGPIGPERLDGRAPPAGPFRLRVTTATIAP